MITIDYQDICRQILPFDLRIRFVGIASIEARVLAAEYRQDVKPLLTPQESELAFMQALMRMAIRRTLEKKLGKTIYSVTLYQKVKRATIAMYDNSSPVDKKCDSILMVSFDKEADHETIITKKILPFLEQMGKTLDEEYPVYNLQNPSP